MISTNMTKEAAPHHNYLSWCQSNDQNLWMSFGEAALVGAPSRG